MKQQPVFTVKSDIATQVAVWNMGRQLGKINKKQPPLYIAKELKVNRETS